MGTFAKLKINYGAASGFTASKGKVPTNCGFTATFPVPFMRPAMVADILAKGISEEDINLAVHSLRNALTVAFLPHVIHETNPSNYHELCVESVAGNALDDYLSFHPRFEVKYKRQMPLAETISVDGVVYPGHHLRVGSCIVKWAFTRLGWASMN